MGKHTSIPKKVEFLTRCEYLTYAQAAEKCGINKSTAIKIKNRAGELLIECEEQGLPVPSLLEQATRKVGSGAKPMISENEISSLIDSCTITKKQRKKLWHIVAKEEGFFHLHRRTIEKKLRERGLRRAKSTKKLGLTESQRAQRYEIALSRRDWTLDQWRMIIYSDEASIIVSAKRGMQNISRMVGESERYHPDCIERRYNNYSEAMFWGCFTYDHKGPCHIYYPETPAQQLANEVRMEKLNKEEIEAECREAFAERERAKRLHEMQRVGSGQ